MENYPGAKPKRPGSRSNTIVQWIAPKTACSIIVQTKDNEIQSNGINPQNKGAVGCSSSMFQL